MQARGAVAEAGAQTRERIVAAALEAFAGNGFQGARMRDIAARAGVPLGLLQYHYGGKLGLWRAAVDRAFAELHSGLAEILDDPVPADESERMRLLIHRYVHFVARNPEFVRLMHDEGKRRGPRMRWIVDRHVKKLFERLASLFERSRALGLVPSDIDPVHFVYVLAGAAGIFFHQAEECRRVAGIDPFAPDAVAAHARAVEHLFLGDSRRESQP